MRCSRAVHACGALRLVGGCTWRHKNVGGVTAGQVPNNSSNVGVVTAGQVGHNSSCVNGRKGGRNEEDGKTEEIKDLRGAGTGGDGPDGMQQSGSSKTDEL